MEWNDLWPLIVTTVVGTFIGFIVTLVMSKAQLKAESKVQENKEEKEARESEHLAMREACKSFLRRTLKDDFEFYKKQGYCSVEDKSEIEDTYKLYHHDLKGNGRGTRYYEAIMSLPDISDSMEENN
jgi:hypothetical protein